MKFDTPLAKGTLIKRYKRFLADIQLENGETVVAHCANSGSMMGLAEPGMTIWLSPNQNPKAKLDWRWEYVEIEGCNVGINTARPNHIVAEAILDGHIPELTGYQALKREVKYGVNSRIDILLDNPHHCYVEVKNTTLKRGDFAEFPDTVTERGAKHLNELSAMVKDGHRAVMFYLINRTDCQFFRLASDLDPYYTQAFNKATDAGVEVLAYTCANDLHGMRIASKIPIKM